MDDKKLLKIASNSSQNQPQLKWGWHKNAKPWLNHWGIQEYAILQNTDIIKNIFTFKFKENNLWCDKELEDKWKLRYYKEVVNPNLEDRKYLSTLNNTKKKINIAKFKPTPTRCITQLGFGQFPKHHGMK
jgi:hypothetical protein